MNEKLTPEQRDMIMDDVIVPFAGADTNWDGISEALDHITTHTEPEDVKGCEWLKCTHWQGNRCVYPQDWCKYNPPSGKDCDYPTPAEDECWCGSKPKRKHHHGEGQQEDK